MSLTRIFLKTATELKSLASNSIRSKVSCGQKIEQKADEFVKLTQNTPQKTEGFLGRTLQRTNQFIKEKFNKAQNAIIKSIKPCQIKRNGDMVFNTNKTETIFEILKKKGYSDSKTAYCSLGETISPRQLELLNKIINLKVENGTSKAFSDIYQIKRILDIKDTEFVNLVLERKYYNKDFSLYHNKNIFKMLAKEKDENGKFLFNLDDIDAYFGTKELTSKDFAFIKNMKKITNAKDESVSSYYLIEYIGKKNEELQNRLLSFYPKTDSFDTAKRICTSEHFNHYSLLMKNKEKITNNDYYDLRTWLDDSNYLEILKAMERNGLDTIPKRADFLSPLIGEQKALYVDYYDALTKLGIKADYETINSLDHCVFVHNIIFNFRNIKNTKDLNIIRSLKLTNGVPLYPALEDVRYLAEKGIKPSAELDKLIIDNKLYVSIRIVYENKYAAQFVKLFNDTIAKYKLVSTKRELQAWLYAIENINKEAFKDLENMLKCLKSHFGLIKDIEAIKYSLENGRHTVIRDILKRTNGDYNEASSYLFRALSELDAVQFKVFQKLIKDKSFNKKMIFVASQKPNIENIKQYFSMLSNLNQKGFNELTEDQLSALVNFLTFDRNKLEFADIPRWTTQVKSLLEDGLFERYPEWKNLPVIKDINAVGSVREWYKLLLEKFDKFCNPITPKNKTSMGNFFNGLAPKKMTETFKNIDFKSPQFQDGLKLKYPRNKFIEDIEKVLKPLSAEEQEQLTKHFGFKLNNKDIIGFPRPNSSVPEDVSQNVIIVSKQLQPIIDNFIYKNRIKIDGSPELEKFANSLTEAFPEFLSIIGKKQHGTHAYTVDIHTLKVLQECIKHPQYKTLSSVDKTILNMSVLFHDIAKAEGVVDSTHYKLSALYMRDILNKLKLPQIMKDRIFNHIDNHHWLGQLADGKIQVGEVIATFRYPQDFKMAKIFANADLKGVSDDFYSRFSNALQSSGIKEIEEKINNTINQTGILLFPTKLLNHYRDYKVIDGLKIIDVANDAPKALKNFSGCKSLDDLHLQVHMANERDLSTSLNTLKVLCKNGNNANLSTSIIAPGCARTYTYRNIGVVLETPETNHLLAMESNLGSGCAKGKSELVQFLHDYAGLKERTFVSEAISNRLGITPQEYSYIFQSAAAKSDITKIKSVKLPSGRIIDKAAIKEAIKSTRKTLLHGTNDVMHNEIVSFNPQIRAVIIKADNLQDIPEVAKTFARDNNLPIILFGTR